MISKWRCVYLNLEVQSAAGNELTGSYSESEGFVLTFWLPKSWFVALPDMWFTAVVCEPNDFNRDIPTIQTPCDRTVVRTAAPLHTTASAHDPAPTPWSSGNVLLPILQQERKAGIRAPMP